MKPSLLRLALAASLFGALPAMSAEEAKPATPVHSALWDATFSAVRELQAADDTHASMPLRFERMAAFRYSPETAAKLVKVFGTDRPITFVRMPAAAKQFAYRAALAPLHYIGPDGASADWTELSVQMSLDQTGRKLAMNGAWASIDAQDKDARFALRQMAFASRQQRGFAGMWFGSARFDIGNLRVEPKTNGMPPLALDDVHVDTVLAEHAKTAEVRYGIGVKAVTIADERIDDLRLALRITNLDKGALAAIKAASEKKNLAALTPQQKAEALKPMLKDLAKAVVMRGAAIDIDDISAGYQGSRASLKGRISVEGASGADLDSIPALLKKLVARFEVKVPLAIVRAVSGKVAQKQLDAQHPGTQADPQAAAQLGQTMTDVVVGKLINAGYARIDNDVLVSTVEWRNGTLRANGKEVSLPKPQQPAIATAPGNGQLLQARRIADTCKLPDYPDDVVRQDLPLQLTMRFVVGTDGHLRDLALAHASASPAYDQAALAAAASCTYIPALRDGKPVEVPTMWRVAREPGSLRP